MYSSGSQKNDEKIKKVSHKSNFHRHAISLRQLLEQMQWFHIEGNKVTVYALALCELVHNQNII